MDRISKFPTVVSSESFDQKQIPNWNFRPHLLFYWASDLIIYLCIWEQRTLNLWANLIPLFPFFIAILFALV